MVVKFKGQQTRLGHQIINLATWAKITFLSGRIISHYREFILSINTVKYNIILWFTTLECSMSKNYNKLFLVMLDSKQNKMIIINLYKQICLIIALASPYGRESFTSDTIQHFPEHITWCFTSMDTHIEASNTKVEASTWRHNSFMI